MHTTKRPTRPLAPFRWESLMYERCPVGRTRREVSLKTNDAIKPEISPRKNRTRSRDLVIRGPAGGSVLVGEGVIALLFGAGDAGNESLCGAAARKRVLPGPRYQPGGSAGEIKRGGEPG